jgi:phage terminase small subunit
MPKGQELTGKQKQFCKEYVSNGFNATMAAIAAGYAKSSASVVGCNNIAKYNVKAEIERLQADRRAKTEYNREQAEQELRELQVLATEKGDLATVLGSTKEKNKLFGLITDKIEHTVAQYGPPEQPEDYLAWLKREQQRIEAQLGAGLCLAD